MIQTDENIAAIRCEIFARAGESLADALRAVKTPEARQHAREVIGAAKMARKWARELRKMHAENGAEAVSEKPTMETDTEMVMCDCGVDYVPVALARALERERDEAREALAARTKQMGVACMKHDLTHALACGYCEKELREALRELVRLKDLHDRIENFAFATRAHVIEARANYDHDKPLAWERARALLGKGAG